MSMTKLETATGKEFETDYFAEHEPSQSIYFRILNAELNTVTEVFRNPEETAVLSYAGKEYSGFTTVDRIEQQSDAIKLRLCHG